MNPVSFVGQNVVFAEDQPEYLALPARRDVDGMVTSCWKLSFKERFTVLFKGKIFVKMLTFNKPLQPIKLDTNP